MQAALTAAWTTHVPVIQRSSPASLVARLLSSRVPSIHSYTFIDFCAGAGGPTPEIEKHLNSSLVGSSKTTSNTSYAEAASAPPPVRFILTDLHPHVDSWSAAAQRSPNVSFVPTSVDASSAPADLIRQEDGKKVFRLFNLAFHHFDDNLARKILKNTVDTSDGFGIFELQDRSFGGGFLTCCLFGLGTLLAAPYYAIMWGAPMALIFTYILPALPFVLVFDGWMSSLRTRTAAEVENMLRGCGGEGVEKWEVSSGSESFMWPVGRVNWVIGLKK
ncbi:hypothetical protein QBC42DRAFT_189597 [Cladorrhinum samala]|uniref:Uncharacterized protein n=1 Tax=Cladorrhinum samala TaxID=585594 RepID=A0AAV9H916_9PEZI|nr:hypothetical protein QBC42DRAFT_189597 [Cladorrhinum samala]